MLKNRTLEKIKKTRDYLDYLENHIKKVSEAWILLQEKCKDMKFIHDDFLFGMIDSEISCHDMSKLSDKEFTQYREHFYPCKKENRRGKKFNRAVNHHIKNNKHHVENWSKNLSNDYENTINCVHMVIDWMAMGDAENYYDTIKESMNISCVYKKLIEEIFFMMNGE